jgi:predicted RNA-binding protein with RPS1 domain
MIHISQLSSMRVEDVSDIVAVDDNVFVKVISLGVCLIGVCDGD